MQDLVSSHAAPGYLRAGTYRDQYHAHYCALVGPAFGDTKAIINEAMLHRVAVWSIDDIARVLRGNFTLAQVRALFEPGVVEDKLDDLVWNVAHGFDRRVRVVAELIKTAGWNAQCRAVLDGRASMNEALSAAGSERAAAREEVEAAFAHLTDALVASAVRLDGADGAIVVTSPS